jgi:Na+-transporting methylmalonyl-CoA/oxaloacetate decarboxylase gamma subunit
MERRQKKKKTNDSFLSFFVFLFVFVCLFLLVFWKREMGDVAARRLSPLYV